MKVALITIGVWTLGLITVGVSLYFSKSDPDSKDEDSNSHQKPRPA